MIGHFWEKLKTFTFFEKMMENWLPSGGRATWQRPQKLKETQNRGGGAHGGAQVCCCVSHMLHRHEDFFRFVFDFFANIADFTVYVVYVVTTVVPVIIVQDTLAPAATPPRQTIPPRLLPHSFVCQTCITVPIWMARWYHCTEPGPPAFENAPPHIPTPLPVA